MYRRYFIGFMATIALIILVIILIFHGSSKPTVPSTSQTLVSYATTNSEVSLTIDGPINADTVHQQIQIAVNNDNATYYHIQGYQGSVVSMQNYPNNVDAYANFLYALQRAGFTEGNNSSSLADERGYCPLGQRFIFELQQNNQVLERYWATDCGGTMTYLGDLPLTLTLFENQIPNFSQLIQNITM